MQISASLTKECSHEWLEKHLEVSAMLGGILSIMHPQQYQQGINNLKYLASHPKLLIDASLLDYILELWSAPFTAITVISNRDTPRHRDVGAAHSCFDLVLTVGAARHVWFSVPGLGIDFAYNNGTVVGLSSRALVHGVHSHGERVCFVYHTKEVVSRTLGSDTLPWANVSTYNY